MSEYEHMQECTNCEISCPLEEFKSNKNGKPTKTCSGCRAKFAQRYVDARERARQINEAETGSTVCTQCKLTKPTEEFVMNDQTYKLCNGCRAKVNECRKQFRATNAATTETKICRNCGETFPVSNFTNDKGIVCTRCTGCRGKRNQTVEGKLTAYKANAKWNGHDWTLTPVQCKILFESPCIYTGDLDGLNGIDRLDSNVGYTESNVASCCSGCNVSKGALDPRTFIMRCVHIHAFHTTGERLHGDLWLDKKPSRYCDYRYRAGKKGIEFEMTKERYAILTECPCVYCGRDITETNKSGIDRVDSSKGYVEGNMTSCCGECNCMKWDMTIDHFYSMVEKITSRASGILPTLPDIPQCLDSKKQFRIKK